MFVLVSYDISDEKRRTRVHKALKSFGLWVQHSVFECELQLKDYVRLRARLESLILPEEDNIRFYRLCESCQLVVERIGGAQPIDEFALFVE